MNREAKFGVLLRHWFRSKGLPTCALELKQSTTNSLAFREVKQEQLNYAAAINSDVGTMIRVIGFNGEPDYIWMRSEPAYIVIKYPDCFVLIGWEIFNNEKMGEKKSLTSERAKEIADYSVDL